MTAREKDLPSVIRSVVDGNVAVFYPCQCDEHESGYDHFVDQLTAALAGGCGVPRVGSGGTGGNHE